MTKKYKYLGPLTIKVHALAPTRSVFWLGEGRERNHFSHQYGPSDTVDLPTPRLFMVESDGTKQKLLFASLSGTDPAFSWGQSAVVPPRLTSGNGPLPENISGSKTRQINKTAVAGLEKIQDEMDASIKKWFAATHAAPRKRTDALSGTIEIGELYSLAPGDLTTDQSLQPVYEKFLKQMKADGKQWEQFKVKEVGWDTETIGTYVRGSGSVKVEKVFDDENHVLEYELDIKMYFYVDTAASKIVMTSEPSEYDTDSPYAKAREEKEEYEKGVREEVEERTKDKDLTDNSPPKPRPVPERPPATQDPSLSEEERSEYDDWWDNMEQLDKQIGLPPPAKDRDAMYVDYVKEGGTLSRAEFEAMLNRLSTIGKSGVHGYPDNTYANYVAKGGTMTEEQYNAYIAKEQAATTATGGGNWLDTLAALAGTGIDKTAEVVLGLGGNATELLKDWGPMGTVGVYTGVKATDAVTKSETLPTWVYAAGAGAVLLLLMR